MEKDNKKAFKLLLKFFIITATLPLWYDSNFINKLLELTNSYFPLLSEYLRINIQNILVSIYVNHITPFCSAAMWLSLSMGSVLNFLLNSLFPIVYADDIEYLIKRRPGSRQYQTFSALGNNFKDISYYEGLKSIDFYKLGIMPFSVTHQEVFDVINKDPKITFNQFRYTHNKEFLNHVIATNASEDLVYSLKIRNPEWQQTYNNLRILGYSDAESNLRIFNKYKIFLFKGKKLQNIKVPSTISE